MNIKTKITSLFAIVTLAASGAVGSLAYLFSSRLLERMTQLELKEQADQVKGGFSDRMQNLAKTVELWTHAREMLEARFGDSNMHLASSILGIKKSYSFVKDIVIVNSKGLVIATTNPVYLDDAKSPDATRRLHAESALKGEVTSSLEVFSYISEPLYDPVTNDKSIIGALLVELNRDVLVSDFSLDDDKPSDYRSLIMDGRNIVFSRTASDFGTNVAPVMSEALRLLPVGFSEARGLWSSADDYVVYQTAIGKSLPGLSRQLDLVVMRQSSAAYASREELARFTALVTLLLAVFFVCVGFFFANSFIRPIFSIRDVAEKIARGQDLTQRVTVHGSDETASLGRSFNALLDEIQTGKAKLEQYSRALENKVELRSDQLTSSAKLSALGEMAANIAHEVNNPLTVILGKATFALRILKEGAGVPLSAEQEADKAKVRSHLLSIEAMAQRIVKIIHGIKTFSRNGDLDPMEPAAMAVLMEDAVALSIIRLKEQAVELRYAYSGNHAVSCRPTQVVQVISNLLANAGDAVGGTPKAWVALDVEERDGQVLIAVTDSGLGLTPEVLDKLMTPFFTTKERGKGTGLGLSISRRIADEHHGRLYYDNKAANTRFVLSLPSLGGAGLPYGLAGPQDVA